jgi:integrase
VREIDAQAWINFVETRQADNKAETRERYINTIVAFLHWCQRRPRKWLDELPEFERNKDARNPRQRARRRVAELSPELISFMIGHAASHLKPQLYIEWSTGWRVSSVLHGIRICDVILAEGRESVTTHFTKNGEPVTAALHPAAARAVATYLQDRGQIHDREAPLFLTQRGQPYSDKSSGAQNKTAFNAMRRRAAQALRERGRDADQADAALIERVTQHWFRHMLATNMLKGGADIGTVMRQGGWLDEKSVLGYDHDVPDFRRQKVTELPIADTSLTRDSIKKGGSR